MRWMAPESLNERKYSSASDVWSFGILCWEVFSFGLRPFKELSNDSAVKAIIKGTKLHRPVACSDKMYDTFPEVYII